MTPWNCSARNTASQTPSPAWTTRARCWSSPPDVLKESYWNTRAQLWYAHDGFGCSPHAIGRSIRCTCLGDGEMTRWNRADFIGVLKDEFLPGWAAEKLTELEVWNKHRVSTRIWVR